MQRVGARPSSLRFQRSKGATNLPHSGQEIVVPASIANLGPGFDTLGVAVSLYLRVRIADVVDDGRSRLACRFADGPLGGPNRIEEAFEDFRRGGVGVRRSLSMYGATFRSEADSAAAPRQRLPGFGLAS